MFTRITFRKHPDPSEEHPYTPEHYVYVSQPAWAESIHATLAFSGYRITSVREDMDPWSWGTGDLWGQRDDDGNLVALLDSEETCDLLYQAANFRGNSRLGERMPVVRPVEYRAREF